MARLFLTPREINFMNDISKELVKDVVGQKIYLYQISEIKSNVHDIYEEAQDKIFDNPIMLDCLVEFEPTFGQFIQHRHPPKHVDYIICWKIENHLRKSLTKNNDWLYSFNFKN